MAFASVQAEEYSYTFTNKQFSTNGSKILNNVNWTLAGDGNYWGYDATKGQQFGSSSNPYKSLTLSTSGIKGTIEKIVINTSGASSVNATFTVKVGGTQYGNSTKLTATATNYTFTGSASGDIVLSYTQTSKKAIYIKSIAVTYKIAGETKETVATPVISPESQTFNEGNSLFVTIATETEDADIYYTLDGKEPSVDNGELYEGEIEITETTTVKAIAVKEGYNSSEVVTKTYTKVVLPGAGEATEVTGNAAVNYGTATIEIGKFEVAPVTLTFAKNNGSTAPAYNKAGDCRIYAKGSITATCSVGVLTKIVFTISDQGKKRITDLTPSTGTVTIADDHSTVTWEGNASEVVLTVGDTSFGTENGKAGQICFTEFTATYVIPSYTLSVTAAGYATLYLDFAATIPAGVEAYTVTAVNDGYVTLTQVAGVLPANTGVIVKADEGEYTFAYSADEAADVAGNLLKGTVADEYITEDACVLSKGANGIGLYGAIKNQLDGTAWLNNANKAYLPAGEVSGAASYSFAFGEGTTGVDEVKAENGNVKGEIYDLTGRRVEAITAPGIYIVNGVKRVVR